MPLLGHDDNALFKDVANDVESTPNSKNYVIIDSLTSEALSKLIYIYI